MAPTSKIGDDEMKLSAIVLSDLTQAELDRLLEFPDKYPFIPPEGTEIHVWRAGADIGHITKIVYSGENQYVCTNEPVSREARFTATISLKQHVYHWVIDRETGTARPASMHDLSIAYIDLLMNYVHPEEPIRA